MTNEQLDKLIEEELQAVLDEKSSKRAKRKRRAKAKKKKAKKRDACYHKVKSRYKVWPSAYASGALVKCRKVGAKNWGNKSKKNEGLNEEESSLEAILKIPELAKDGLSFNDLIKQVGMSREDVVAIYQDNSELFSSVWRDGGKKLVLSKRGQEALNYLLNPPTDDERRKRDLLNKAALGGMFFEEEESPLHKVAMALDDAGGAADFEKLEKVTKLSRKEIQDVIDNNKDIVVHKAGDVIELSGLDEGRGRGCRIRISEETLEEKKRKKACKPSKGKRFAKRVNGKCRSFGQKGQAKGGGDRIRPGTKKGDAYCAQSAGQMKKHPTAAKDPNSPLRLSRKRWKCAGTKSKRK